jgi:hypothetical protein
MLRIGLTIILPLLVPTGLYLVWIMVLGAPREKGDGRWAKIPWVGLAGAGVALLAIVLFGITVGFGTAQRGVYVAPQWLNGRIVPGHIAPLPRQ